MAINRDKPDRWKEDISLSVDFYNCWFMNFAPATFRETRKKTAQKVERTLRETKQLTEVSVDLLKSHPETLPILRMSTCPPIARDRLIGLAGVSANLVGNMESAEGSRISPRMHEEELHSQLERISAIITKMADPDIFVWIGRDRAATRQEIRRAATIVADRLCGAVSDPIIRNAQERRQLTAISQYLTGKGYNFLSPGTGAKFNQMRPGSFSFRTNVPVQIINNSEEKFDVNIPVDVVVMPLTSKTGDMPLLIEAKSAGDFTNVNKRRKEEAQKMQLLRNTYGTGVRYCLFLCGYFDSGYLGYEAAEGIDWIWEHRIEDLNQCSL